MKKLLFFILFFIPVLLQAQTMPELAQSLDGEFKSEKAAEGRGDKKALAHIYGNIAETYLNIGKLSAEEIQPGGAVPAGRKDNLKKAIEYSDKSAEMCEAVGDGDQLKAAYQTKYTAEKAAGKIKDAMSTYAKLTSLKHGILSKKGGELELKQAEYEHKKREDSIRHEQELAEQRLKEQTQALAQQKQQLEATNQNLTKAQKDKENVSHQLQQTQTDLSTEKTNSEEKTKQLTQAEEEKALQAANLQLQQNKLQLQQNEIQMKDRDLSERKKEQYLYLAGLAVLLVFTVLIYRSFNLQKKFNTALLTEKKRSQELLLNILPAEVAGELMEKGFADAKHFYDVTVLFTDFVNFTSVTESMTPQQLVSELHVCFKAFDGILGKYHIEKIKTVGDAYLAVAGLPIANPNHAADVVAASIEIRDFMTKRQKELGNSTFGIRIGINSGNVVAGIVGVKKFAYDIWGDTVNIAARMEQNSEEGKINISEATYQLVKDKHPCIYRGKIEAKNKGSIDMYYIA